VGAALILGLLLFGGGSLINSAGGKVGGGTPIALAGIAPLAASTNTTSVATTFPTSLWEDASGNEIQLTMAPTNVEVMTPGGVEVVQTDYEITTEVLDNLSCPAAEGGSYISGTEVWQSELD
jgi:hypothetical protein